MTQFERGYQRALADVLDYAKHWRWLESGGRGTGEAFAVEFVVLAIRPGRRAPRHTGRRAAQIVARAEREHAELHRLAGDT